MIDFRNTKIRILSPEHSVQFQQAVFSAGGNWIHGNTSINHVDEPYLFVDVSLNISRGQFEVVFMRCNFKEITFPSPSTKEGHPHAEIMLELAEVAKTNPKPWEEFQTYDPDTHKWYVCSSLMYFDKNIVYRRKPKMKLIHGVEVPDISIEPKCNEGYYSPSTNHPRGYSRKVNTFDIIDNHLSQGGMCYPDSEDGKQAAIMHSKAMLGIDI